MAACVGSPASLTSRAAPAVSPEITGVRPCSRMILRHWPSAWTWLCTVRTWSMVVPGRPISANWMRRKCSATMCRLLLGRKWWMSATRPASELSIGIIARSASPPSTVAKTSSKLAQATASQSG